MRKHMNQLDSAIVDSVIFALSLITHTHTHFFLWNCLKVNCVHQYLSPLNTLLLRIKIKVAYKGISTKLF